MRFSVGIGRFYVSINLIICRKILKKSFFIFFSSICTKNHFYFYFHFFIKLKVISAFRQNFRDNLNARLKILNDVLVEKIYVDFKLF